VRCHYDPTVAPAHVLVLGVMAMLLVPQLAPGSFAWPINFVAWTLLWELIVNFVYARWLRRASTLVLLIVGAPLLALATGVALTSPRGWSFGMGSGDLWLGGLRALPEFLIGVALYRWYQAGAFARLPLVSPLVPLAAWLALASLPPGLSPLVDLAIVVVAAPLAIMLLVRGEAQAPAWFTPLGAVSYPLYAAHLGVIGLAQHTPLLGLNHGPSPLLAAFVVLLALGLAWMIHLWCDPARRIGRAPGFRASAVSRRYRAS
jgi:peptidoglycan/LPS O-acetylase OafA/YrhL